MTNTLKIAIIGIPGAWSSEILKETFIKNNHSAEILKAEALTFRVSENKVFHNTTDLERFDAIIIKKLGDYSPSILDRLDVLSNLEDKGLRFFSSPKKLKNMISRIGCTRSLAALKIPMPETIITENSTDALAWVQSKAGAVFKPNFSTKARGMEVLQPENTNLEKLDALKQNFGQLYLQELVELPGKDFGVVFSGSKYLGTYARVASKDSWNTTTQDGGHYESFEPSDEIIELAKKARSAFDLDFCCVDIAETPKGPIVFEVSAFGGFKGLFKGAGINSAEVLYHYIINTI